MIYSAMKGAPLTSQDMDDNFKDLETRLHHLEKNEFQDFGIVRIEVQGDRLIFKGPSDVVLGHAQLPTLFFKSKGTWRPNTSYEVFDYIIKDEKVYICREDHRSNEQFDLLFWHLQGDHHD